jgi:peptidyl-prolyl cis-trans isomerase D
MLTDLREKSQSFLVYILFGVLIFVFIFFFGPQAEGCQPNTPTPRTVAGWAASVNGQDISVKEVNLSVWRRKRFDQAFPDEAAAIARLSQDFVQQIVEQSILEQQALKMGITVGDKELTRFIVSMKNYPDSLLFRDREGRIVAKDYRSTLSNQLGTSPDIYRRAKKRELIVRRYMDFLVSTVKVSEAEIKEEFERRARTWNLEYVNFDPKVYAKTIAAPSAEAISEFSKTKAADVKAAYDKNKARYQRDKEVRISRILVRKPESKTDTAGIAKAKAAAGDLLAQARKAGADFGALAKASSQGVYKDRGTGGDMGWRTSKSSDYKVFAALSKGQISDLQEDTGWFYFAKATDVRSAINKSLADATADIARTLIVEAAAAKAARADADARLAMAKKSGSLETPKPTPVPVVTPEGEAPAAAPVVAEIPSDVRTTGPIRDNRGSWSQINGIGKSEVLAKALPGLTDKAPLVDAVVDVSGRYVVAKLKERVEPKGEELDKQRGELTSTLMRARAYELFGDWNQVLFGFSGRRQLAKRGALLGNLAQGVAIKINQNAFRVQVPKKPSAPAPETAK